MSNGDTFETRFDRAIGSLMAHPGDAAVSQIVITELIELAADVGDFIAELEDNAAYDQGLIGDLEAQLSALEQGADIVDPRTTGGEGLPRGGPAGGAQ